MKKILRTDRLPKDGQYVLAYFPDMPWDDPDAKNNHHKMVVVKFERGISVKEREALPDSDERKRMYTSADEDGNNEVPYFWDSFGPGSFFGQEAECWYELPET